jgi:CheY-like chemotaxis protein
MALGRLVIETAGAAARFQRMPSDPAIRESSQPVVLIVEDEELLRVHAANLLEDAGFEVVHAADADAALEILTGRNDVRVLFTDIQMPGEFNGMELAHRVHEQWPNVLLLITSGAAPPLQADIADLGHFLPKPYTPDQVVKEIRDLGREAEARRRSPDMRGVRR